MTGDSEFRSSEQEVLRLLEECAELRRTLKTISAQIGRMENRAKRAFPGVAEKARVRSAQKVLKSDAPSMPPEQALAEFDAIVKLAASGATEEANAHFETSPRPTYSQSPKN